MKEESKETIHKTTCLNFLAEHSMDELKFLTCTFLISRSFKQSLADFVKFAQTSSINYALINSQSIQDYINCYLNEYGFIEHKEMDSLFKELQENKFSFINFLIKQKIDFTYCTSPKKFNLLYAITSSRKLNLISALKEQGYDLNTISSPYGLTPLIEMVVGKGSGIQEMRTWLIQNADIDVNRTESFPDGCTALMYACVKDDEDTVKLLLDNGADPDIERSEEKTTALFLADKPSIIHHLLQKGANPNKQDKDGCTPFYYHIAHGKYPDDYIALPRPFLPCTDFLKIHTRLDLVHEYLRYNADPTIQNNLGLNVIFVAASCGYKVIMDALLALENINLNLQDMNGLTALSYALQNGRTSSFKKLLNKNADPNIAANDGFTPLLISVEMGNLRTTKLLLQKNADPNCRAQDGTTPLMIAQRNNNTKMERLLRKYGAQ